MVRSSKKGAYADEKLLKKVKRAQATRDRKPIKTWSRRSTITPEFVGLNFSVYNGRKFLAVFVTENMVGYKFGDFVATRTFRKHGGVKAKKAPQKT